MPERDIRNLETLDAITARRTLSNYFFIATNFAVFFANLGLALWLSSLGTSMQQQLRSIIVCLPVAVVAIFVCMYWYTEQRELHIQHEVRFRALRDEERIYSERGLVSKEWDRIGDYPFRMTPVFFVRSASLLPLLFASMHLLPIYVVLIARLFLHAL